MATRKPAEAADEYRFDEEIYDKDGFADVTTALLSKFGVDELDAEVHVYKVNEAGAEAGVWRGEPDSYDLPEIAREFGSGKYRVKLYVRDPASNRKVIHLNKAYAWQLRPDEEQRLRERKDGVPRQSVDVRTEVANAVAGAMRDMLQQMLPMFQQMMQPREQPNPLGQMKEMAEIMRTIAPPAPAQQADQLGMLKTAMEFINTMRGDMEPMERGANASGNDVLLGMINKFGPLLAGALPQAAQQAVPPIAVPGAVQQAPVPLVAPNEVQVTPVLSPEEEEVSMRLKMGLAFLVGQCQLGVSPETCAGLIVENVPEADLRQIIAAPDPVGVLAAVDAKVGAHREWFGRVLAECKEILDTPFESDEVAT